MKIENRVSVSLPQISFVIFVLSAACLKSVCVPLFVRECVFVCACLGGGGTGDSKTLTSCTPPFSLSLSLSLHRHGPWQVLVTMATLTLPQAGSSEARWLKKKAWEEREREGERDHCRGRGEQARIGPPIHYLPPPQKKKKNSTQPPQQSYHWHRHGWAVERPLLCSVVWTRWIQTSDCIYYSSSSSSIADSTAA